MPSFNKLKRGCQMFEWWERKIALEFGTVRKGGGFCDHHNPWAIQKMGKVESLTNMIILNLDK